MFEQDQITGIGLSVDDHFNKYIGEHESGGRNGFGIFEMKDGKTYEGCWRKNRLHGRCHETLETGQSYLVYFNNGKRMEIIGMDVKH